MKIGLLKIKLYPAKKHKYVEIICFQIKTYPRTMESSLRRKEDKRKKKREELTERKKKELEKRSLEIKQLKKLKKKEIIDRIRKLQEITGNKRVGFEVVK